MERLIELRDELIASLPEVDISNGNDVLVEIKAAIHIVQDYIGQLKALKPARFKEPKWEVAFYKDISPVFYSFLIYYVRLFTIATELLPPCDSTKKIYAKELRRIGRYYERQKKMHRYFFLKESSFDHQFFTQQSFLSPLTVYEDAYLADQELCTPIGLIFARFMAYERLHEFLNRNLKNLPQKGEPSVYGSGSFEVQWTDKKVHLQELIYALAYSHSINNGNIDVKALARVFETVFKTDLSNIYRAKQDMYTRRNVSAYLDFLKQRFREGVDEADDRNNYR